MRQTGYSKTGVSGKGNCMHKYTEIEIKMANLGNQNFCVTNTESKNGQGAR